MTRALYLGMTHASASLRAWPALTSGRPAVLDHAGAELRGRLARMIGMPKVTLAPSTLHLVTDLYAALPSRVRAIHVDACVYAVTRWGLERAKLRGIPIHRFRSVHELEGRLEDGAAIVTDAMCMTCRCIKPLRRLAELAERHRSWVVIDDTQGLGLLGADPSPAMPFGHGGAGTSAWCGAPMHRCIVLGSLAKGMGVPLACLAASESVVRWFEQASETRIHASSCSAAALSALASALGKLEREGETLRARLLDRVRTFRESASADVLAPGMFPVQTTRTLPATHARALQARLAASGVQTLALRARPGQGRIAFLVTANHHPDRLATAGRILADACASLRAIAA